MRGKIDELILYHSRTIQVSTNSYITLEFIEILTIFLDFWLNSSGHTVKGAILFSVPIHFFLFSFFKVARGSLCMIVKDKQLLTYTGENIQSIKQS